MGFKRTLAAFILIIGGFSVIKVSVVVGVIIILVGLYLLLGSGSKKE